MIWHGIFFFLAICQEMCQLKSFFEAKEARAVPPLGPLLAQFQLDLQRVCKELNELSKNYEQGVSISVKIDIDEFKNYNIIISGPTLSFLYNQIIEDNLKLNLLLFYDLVKLFCFYHNFEVSQSKVKEILASLSSMKAGSIKC